MARTGYYTNPWEKKLEEYADYSGGLNTVSGDDAMPDREFRDLTNGDLGEKGVLKKRWGCEAHLVSSLHDKHQGYFRFYKDGALHSEIVAADGGFYINDILQPITGLPGGFQTERMIEGVQYRKKMYFATGTKLVEYDGTSFKTVEPKKPDTFEALYIGTNALASNPNEYMQDREGLHLNINGTTFSRRYGLVNEPTTLTVYLTKPANMTSIEFMYEWRTLYMDEGDWVQENGGQWTTSRTFTITPQAEGDLQFRINAREAGKTVAETQMVIPKYTVKGAPDPKESLNTLTLHNCNRLFLHWERIMMYGDPQNPDVLYYSHLREPEYFPRTNFLRFENSRSEGLTTVKQFRNMLVAFTRTTTSALFGTAPAGSNPYKRVVLNTAIGCIAPESAVVVRNHIMFLSQEGIQLLKNVGTVEDLANMQKMDIKIDNIVTRAEDACAVVHDGQYQICFPKEKKRLRFYLDLGSWTKDESPSLNFLRMYDVDGVLYAIQENKAVVRFSAALWTDQGVPYPFVFETRNMALGQTYHTKKLKQLQMLLSPKYGSISATIYVYADSAAMIDADRSYASVGADGAVQWNTVIEPNFHIPGGTTLGDWKMGKNAFGVVETMKTKLNVSGKCRTTRIRFIHMEGKPCVVTGHAFVFKVKKP